MKLIYFKSKEEIIKNALLQSIANMMLAMNIMPIEQFEVFINDFLLDLESKDLDEVCRIYDMTYYEVIQYESKFKNSQFDNNTCD